MNAMTKRIAIAFFLLCMFNNAFAQNVTIEQVLSLRTKPLSYIDEFLTGKNWELIEANEPSDEKIGELSFAYKKSSIDDTAESFINFYYTNYSVSNNMLSFQVITPSKYNSYLTKIKALGYKLQNSFVDKGELIKVYQKNGITIKINTSTQKDDEDSSTQTTYVFNILTNSMYNIIYNP